MTTLEATVEIVKATMNLGGHSTGSLTVLLTHERNRNELLTGIEQLYNKLKELEGLQ